MKSVRIIPKRDQKKTINIFDSVESAYIQHSEKLDITKMNECFQLTLEGDESVEIEWMGCEFVYEQDGTHKRFDNIRMGKLSPTKNSSGTVVETFTGWTSSDDITFSDHSDSNSQTSVLTPENCSIDLITLFEDEEPTLNF